jgi:hypothetical protein
VTEAHGREGSGPDAGGSHSTSWLRAWLPDIVGVAFVLAAAAAVMLPALAHGSSLGPIGSLTNSGLSLSRRSGQRVSDQLTLFIPWTSLAWTQVHHGQLPLWNPYSVLGMPLAFNWESAPFGLPALIGYLVPINYAYTVGVLVSLVLAGTGVYVLARVMGLTIVSCVMAATVYELSGRFMATLGWSLGSVMSWAGWLFALAILVGRGRHRWRDIALLAVAIALMVYSGYPEGVMLLGAALGVFLVVLLGVRVLWPGKWGPIRRPVDDLVLAAVAGAALSAPLSLPGLQVAAGSSRNGKIGVSIQTLGSPLLKNLVLNGFDGLKSNGSHYFGPHTDGSTVIYVGVIAVVLAVLAVAIRWRQPLVIAFAAVSIVMTGLVFVAPLASVLDRLPEVGSVRLYDALGPLALAIAILAGVGTDILVSSPRRRSVHYWAGGGFMVVGLLLLTLWAFDRGHLRPVDTAIREHSFIWPAAESVVGLVVTGVLVVATQRSRRSPDSGPASWPGIGRWAAAALLVCSTIFLVTAGTPTFSSSPTPLKPTAADLSLRRSIGSSVVGLGMSCAGSQTLGIILNVNVAFQIPEFGVYDPTVPYKYVTAWDAAAARRADGSATAPAVHAWSNVFCPKVTTSSAARRFGIGFVLEHRGAAGPRGAVFDKRIGNQALYRIPGAASATLTPLSAKGDFPSDNAIGAPVAVTHPDPASWKVVTHAVTAQVLRLRLTDLPGWHATIDGQPLSLTTFSGVMIQARIPPGRHIIELRYWPNSFSVGIVLALVALAGLVLAVVAETVRRRKRTRPNLNLTAAPSGTVG